MKPSKELRESNFVRLVFDLPYPISYFNEIGQIVSIAQITIMYGAFTKMERPIVKP